MLQRPTVFVLGAGASYELGLPLGEALRDTIARLVDIRYEDGRQISGDAKLNQYLREMARQRDYPSINGLLYKCWLMRDALPGAISIDNLIDAHRADAEFAEIAKMAIAMAILEAERNSKLYARSSGPNDFRLSSVSGTYLIPLFQILNENLSRDDVSKIFRGVSPCHTAIDS